MELQVRSAADLEAGRSQRELLVHVGWFESACPICHWCCAACASWLRRLCCACARTGRPKAAPGRWTSAEGEPLTLDYGLGGGGCMWACAAVSLFFTLCGAALFIWEYEQCEELTFSELFMGAECDAVLDGSAGSSAALLPAELPAEALACETDYDCEITGACNATSGTCEYEDERLTKGPFLLLGGVSALLAAVCGGTRGGWKREVLEILPQPEGEGEGWTLRISERKWAPFCGRVDRPVSDLPPTARAGVKKITLTSRERVLGYTVAMKGLYVPDAEPNETDVVWHGQPLELWEAKEIAKRINEFLGVKPEEPAAQPRRRGSPSEGVPGEGRSGQQAVRSPRSRRRPVSPAPRPEHLSSRRADPTASAAPARTASQESWNSRTVAEATERHASAAVVAGEHELLQVQIDEARHDLEQAEKQLAAIAPLEARDDQDCRGLLETLQVERGRLRREHSKMTPALQAEAKLALEEVEREMQTCLQQLEGMEAVAGVAHRLELLLTKRRLMQLPEQGDDVRAAVRDIDAELWPRAVDEQRTGSGRARRGGGRQSPRTPTAEP